MKPQVRTSFNHVTTPAQAAALWNGDPATLSLIGKSQNFVYRFAAPGNVWRVLRLTHASHRSAKAIDAELEFIEYLKSEGCGVAAAVPSADGYLIEPVGPEAGEYHAVAFEEVAAPKVRWGRDPHNRQLLLDLGRWLGKMHVKSQHYQPRRAIRFHWFEDHLYDEPEQYIPESEPGIRKELGELISWANRRSVSRENYGLVHGDLWVTNYRIMDGQIIAFDFDDCCQHWFTYDIAVAIAAARRLPPKYRQPYLQVFLEGYTKEKDLQGDGIPEVEWLSRLAAMHRYISSVRHSDLNNLTPREQRTLADRRREVLEPITWR